MRDMTFIDFSIPIDWRRCKCCTCDLDLNFKVRNLNLYHGNGESERKNMRQMSFIYIYIYIYIYSPLNDIIANIIFRDLDLNFEGEHFEISIRFKR